MSQTILVSAGHGAGDPGARGPGGPRYPFTEADLTLEQRDLVAPLLERQGFNVLRDGKAGENRDRSYAHSLVRQADFAIEFHFNSHRDLATGVECFGLSDKAAICTELSRAVANVLGLKLRGRGGFRDPSESQHPSLGFCSKGGVILETCFMFAPDLDRYVPEKQAVAKAIAETLSKHMRFGSKGRTASLRNDRALCRTRFRTGACS